MPPVTNVASVPHRTPFRYPGGKTWLVPQVRRWLAALPQRPAVFCEPFCGGAIVGLSVLFEDLVDRLMLVELDTDVAAVWQTILEGDCEELIWRIGEFEVTHENVRGVLTCPAVSTIDRAFATIVRNRVQRGGILAPGASLMKLGENGRGLKSRWYPETLQRRIRGICAQRGKIDLLHGDGLDALTASSAQSNFVYFIDPPYTIAGRRLYVHSEIDHERLFRICSRLAGDFLITYDDAAAVRDLAERFGFDTHLIPMKNTHHRIQFELIVGRNLDWARREARELSQNALFELV